MRLVISLFTGLVFGFGLILSHMVNPAVVRGFLDFAGQWNPSLGFVLGGAVLMSIIAWRVRDRRFEPVFGGDFPAPAPQIIDKKLISGSIMFGIGWGLVGLCPGPAIVGLGFGFTNIWIFVAAMFIGMGAFQFYNRS